MDIPPPVGGNQDRGYQLIGLYWAMSGIAIVVVTMRITGRLMIRQVGADDYVMLFTLLLFLILASFVTYYASIGGCKHLYYLTPPEQGLAVKYNWISQPWGIFGFATGKISVALLILRLIGPNTTWRKWMLYFSMVTVFLINALGCILTFVQCNPPRALWEPQLLMSGQATCWDPSVQGDYALFLSAWNIFIDVVLAVLPLTLFWGLKMKTRTKVGLCALLGLGLLAAVAGIVKVNYLAGLNARSDLTWETYNLFAWSGAELFVIIVCGSIPPIKPIYDRFCKPKGASRIGATNYYGQYGSQYAPNSHSHYGPKSVNHYHSNSSRSHSDRQTFLRDHSLEEYPQHPPPLGYVRKATEVNVY